MKVNGIVIVSGDTTGGHRDGIQILFSINYKTYFSEKPACALVWPCSSDGIMGNNSGLSRP